MFILVDGGPYLFEVDRLRVQFGVRKLALAVLTHQHQNHARELLARQLKSGGPSFCGQMRMRLFGEEVALGWEWKSGRL